MPVQGLLIEARERAGCARSLKRPYRRHMHRRSLKREPRRSASPSLIEATVETVSAGLPLKA